MKAYPVYQDSGIPWLGMIPESWNIIRLRNLLHKTTQKDRPDLPLLSVVRELGVILRDVESKEENHNFIPDDLSNYKVLLDGQFVINKMKAWQGSYAISSLTGIVSPAYFIYNVDYRNLLPQFFNVAIRSRAYIGFFNQASDGVRIGQWDLDEAQMRNIPFLIPSLSEQKAIVAYLDKKCTEIQELINRRHTMIELLKELKRSIIAKAVTKGLNPDVPMKDSGIPWLGKIPEHWAARKIKTLFRIKKEIAGKEGLNVLSITQQGIKIKDIESNEGQIAQSYTNYQLLEVGEFAMNHMDLLTGWVGISPFNGVTSPDYRVFVRSEENASSKYLLYALQTCYSRKLFYGLAQGVSSIGRCRLQTSKFKNFVLPFPSVEEQKAIVAYLDKKCPDIDNLISRHEQSIEKLKELRTATIANVVTGKVDVRDSI